MDKPTLIHYKIFKAFDNLLAFTTTKQSIETKNARFTGDSGKDYLNSRKQLATKLGLEPHQLLFPRQMHTSCVAEINQIPSCEISKTDALVTNREGICLCVQTADCVPILLFDPVKKVVAAVHAGWRGTVGKIVEITIEKMKTTFNASPQNILAAIGPSISLEIYEVGDEVVDAAKKSLPRPERSLLKKESGKYHFNLWEANRQILVQNGIKNDNIEIIGECSFCKANNYFSARKEGINTGRIVSGIMLY